MTRNMIAVGLYLLATMAAGQERVEPEVPDGRRVQMTASDYTRTRIESRKLGMLRQPAVQSELGLSKETVDGIDKLFVERSQVGREVRDDPRATIEFRQELANDYLAKIEALLTPAQQTRLNQILLQSLGDEVFELEEVVDKLQISSDQLRDIRRRTRGQSWRGREISGDSKEASLAKSLQYLDDDQKALFKSMLGKPFNAVGSGAEGDEFHPRSTAVSVSELRDAIGLDLYKYVVFMRQGEKFQLVLREYAAKDAKPVELLRETFTPTRDGDIDILLYFKKQDGILGSALLSNDEQLEAQITCRLCEPYQAKTIFRTPLATVPDKGVYSRGHRLPRPGGATGSQLLLLKHKNADGAPMPCAELVIEKVREADK